jgi:serine/threonine-protein kinase
MNQRLPTGDSEAHFWANSSRDLIKAIEYTNQLQKGLEKSRYSLEIDAYYQELINKCSIFLQKTGGSTIPPNMEKVELYYTIPIFKLIDVIEKEEPNLKAYPLKLIGEGSYARVYKYRDNYYQKDFVLKRAKSDLNEKEKIRFKQEFDEMAKLASPYVIEVYRYDAEKEEYIMECMDYTLHDYIEKNNATMKKESRKTIGLQILKAFKYINSKNLLHRDISPSNILIKEYEDSIIVKVSDFGLVKCFQSKLTSIQTELKGCFNDPNLYVEGFSNYTLQHEIYALTKLLCYVITGKMNLDKVDDPKIKAFIKGGMNADKSKRFENLDILRKSFLDLFE